MWHKTQWNHSTGNKEIGKQQRQNKKFLVSFFLYICCFCSCVVDVYWVFSFGSLYICYLNAIMSSCTTLLTYLQMDQSTLFAPMDFVTVSTPIFLDLWKFKNDFQQLKNKHILCHCFQYIFHLNPYFDNLLK